ncbi:hypothetical protein [Persicobacter psychrovividus]|uniref:HTH cro/C1-type domain-containing protein n=1 Tax=Persicobacter psychrovividus TaxID=387638 RepID=A0ABM7VJB8_9BACT|nr:hypothetical protein PEPS_31560 [Persicobacter psychrovividus]
MGKKGGKISLKEINQSLDNIDITLTQIDELIKGLNISYAEIGTEMGTTYQTILKKMKDPHSMKINEIRELLVAIDKICKDKIAYMQDLIA